MTDPNPIDRPSTPSPTRRHARRLAAAARAAAGPMAILAALLLAAPAAAQDGRRVIARGAESYGPVTPIRTVALRELAQVEAWKPGDPIKEVPRRFFPLPDGKQFTPGQGLPDPLLDRQLGRSAERAPSIITGLNFDGQGFTGATPPDTVGDVGPDHYVQAVNASQIAIYDKTGAMLPGYPVSLESLAPAPPCTNGSGDPIVLYDWLADRWLLQEFTGGGTLCIYISATADPTGSYNFYSFVPPIFPDSPHYGVWPDAYYAATNESDSAEPPYAFDRLAMLAGDPATMQRLTVVPSVSGYGFQTLTPADHDGDAPPPAGAPGIFMRHNDDEAHSGSPEPATDFLEMWEMDVDFANPGNTTVTSLPDVLITDFNSWMINYTTFFSTPQPGSSNLLDAIREVILQRLVYRNFGSHETLLGVFAANRDPATSGSAVEQGNRWFELRRSGGGWALHDEGTFGGDSNSADANFFMGSVAMDKQGNIALGYSKTDVGAAPVFPSIGFTGRLAGDPAGTLGPENDVVPGGGPSGSGRWGDYANMSIDPADDCTFWFTNEYIPVTNTWGTRINSFSFDECNVGFVLTPTPTQLDVCAPTDPDATFDIDVTAVGGWSFAVDLSAGGEPPGTTSTFVPDNQLPNFTSTYTLLGTGGSTTGVYTIDILGTGANATTTTADTQVTLNLAVATPGAATLVGPPDAAAGVGLTPTLSWAPAGDAVTYDVEVATDAGFTNVVYTATGLTTTSHTVASVLDPSSVYHWRVTSNNVCGSVTGGAFTFTTLTSACDTFSSGDVPKAIPEGGGTSGTTTSTLLISAGNSGIITDVNVLDLMGSHTYMGELDFFVESPAGTPVQIREADCGSTEDFDLNYDDEAAPGAPPCPPTDGGTYQPDSPLAAFDGESSKGTWTLTIVDNFQGDQGQLDSWGLEVCIESCPEDPLVIANQPISDARSYGTCGTITVGPNVTVTSGGSLDLASPEIIFRADVAILGTLSAGEL